MLKTLNKLQSKIRIWLKEKIIEIQNAKPVLMNDLFRNKNDFSFGKLPSQIKFLN